MKTIRSKSRKPTPPGKILSEDILPALKMSQRKIAGALGVSRYKISRLLEGRYSIRADMAIRLARFLGGTPDGWLNMQRALDIWQLEQDNAKEYEKIRSI